MSDSSTGNYGENLVENGEFLYPSGWSLSGGAQYADGMVSFPPEGSIFKTISQPLDLIPGRQYLVRYTLSIISGNINSNVILGSNNYFHGNSQGVLSAILTADEDGFIRISVEMNNLGEATITSVIVREILENSESSLFLALSSSISNSSSTKLLDSSISSTSSSITTHSSESSFSTNSSSSFSQSSSSSSGQNCYFDFPFKIEVFQESPVWCFERVGETVYAGTGRDGVVLQSTDLNIWTPWKTVEDSHVRSLKFYANGLFIGTEPKGYIYTYNFSTNSFYRHVETYDYAITAMAIFRGVLYVGTSPGGILYTFNGDYWDKQTQFYGGGITSLFVQDDKLYVSVKSAETIIVFDDSWKIAPTNQIIIPEGLGLIDEKAKAEGALTISSNRNLSTEPVSESDLKFIDRTKISIVNKMISDKILDYYDSLSISPPNPETEITSINSFEGNLLIGGKSGRVLKYDGEAFKAVHNDSNSGIVKISNDGFFCSENSLFVLQENEQNDE